MEKKEKWNHQYQEDISRLKDEISGKDLAIQALSNTLIDKGDEN